MRGQIQISLMLVLVIILAAIGGIFILNYNDIVRGEKVTEEAAAQIEVVCQRRLDLIPNLVETVKAYAQYERGTLEAVIKARSQAQDVLQQLAKKSSLSKEDLAALSASQAQVSAGLKALFALVENYPNLKANTNFLALQDQLEGTENRIAVARERFNVAVRIYNTRIQTFPGNIVAPMFSFDEKVYFETKKEALEGVKVQF